MARRSTNRELILVALRGETEPVELKLDRARVISIGRTGNIRIHDPLVSIHHAKLFYDMEERSWVMEDLGSANGTFVNGECVRGEARLVRRGTELRFGETVFEIRPANRSFAWVRPLVLLTPVLLGLLFVLRYLLLLFGGPTSAGELELPEAATVANQGRIESVPLDAEFMWDHGVGWPLEVHQVTEVRERQSDLAWVLDHGRKRVLAITFDHDLRWQLLGDLPPGGQIGDSRETVFPSYKVLSEGESWLFDADRGVYRATSQQGLVVWYRRMPAALERDPSQPFSPPQAPGPLEVGRFSIKGDPNRLALFLTERNVQVPVHYVICEGAFPGVRAQVRTYEGLAEELQPACLRSLRIEGLEEDVLPVAVALDPEGRQALIEDVTTFYAGDPSGLFLPARFEDEVARLKADPGTNKGGVKLVISSDLAIPPPFSPYPEPGGELPVGRQLVPNPADVALGRAAPLSSSQRLPYPGLQDERETLVPIEGCEQLKVVTHGQFQPASIFGATPFADVYSVGCGQDRWLFSVDYTSYTAVHADPAGTDVALKVEMDGERVRTAILGWRP